MGDGGGGDGGGWKIIAKNLSLSRSISVLAGLVEAAQVGLSLTNLHLQSSHYAKIEVCIGYRCRPTMYISEVLMYM